MFISFRLYFVLIIIVCSSALAAQGSCVSGDCESGYGTYRFVDGARYVGDFKKGELHGGGILYYPDGSRYMGNFYKQLQQGKGRLVMADGTVYFGMWSKGQYHGKGELTFGNGNKLEGEWINGQSAGVGTFYFANGDEYKGEILNNALHGHGTMNYENGDRYVGDWHDNRRHGRGKLLMEDGTELDGNWTTDQYLADWDRLGYQGRPDELVKCAGNDCPDGKGYFRYPDGTTYEGDMRGGQPNGQGTVIYADGQRYAGNYRNHRPEGLGVMRYVDGVITGGIWREGRLYRKLYTSQGRPAAPVAVDADPEVKVWAVIVGAERYQHMPSLKYTKSDAFYLYAHLRSPEGGALPASQIRLLVDENATHRNIIMAMRDVYLRADENDVVLFYFSGHGLQGAFLPVDYDGFENRLEHYEIRDALLATRARHKLVIADACHSGSLSSGISDGQGLAARNLDKKLARYYNALNEAHAGTALLLSSKGIEYSLEDGGLRSGVFSHFLIQGLEGEADQNQDDMVSIEELFRYVHRETRTYTGNQQTPTLSGDYDPTMPVSLVRD
ncbi:peptidase C14 caspase catalytic subunit p20 [Lewinellaceae bacterium SD302]|nr:peptidase C14 caspase catalytic subunit p20 [Lewinellaceae bacterium SD302]